MKKMATIFLLLAGNSFAFDAASLQTCGDFAGAARAIMELRQLETPIEDVAAMIENAAVETEVSDVFKNMLVVAMQNAYKVDIESDEKQQAALIDSFANMSFDVCYRTPS